MRKTEPKTERSTAEKVVDIASGVLDWVFIIFFLIVLLFACYAIYDSAKIYKEAKLPEIALKHVKETEDGGRVIDFEGLIAENSDTTAWLTLDDMSIDYVVMYYSNNDYYLSHGFDKQFANTGTLFVDYRNTRGWGDSYNLIYGHNMNGDMMFGPLNRFRDAEFFESHRTGKLYTPEGNFSLEVIAEMVSDKDNKDVYNISALKNDLPKMKEYILANAGQKRTESIKNATKIIALSTCKGDSGKRQIVFLKATKD